MAQAKIDALSITWLEDRGACDEAMAWIKSRCDNNLDLAWEICHNPDWMIWSLAVLKKLDVNGQVPSRLGARIKLDVCLDIPVRDGKNIRDYMSKGALEYLSADDGYGRGLTDTVLRIAERQSWKRANDDNCWGPKSAFESIADQAGWGMVGTAVRGGLRMATMDRYENVLEYRDNFNQQACDIIRKHVPALPSNEWPDPDFPHYVRNRLRVRTRG